MQEGKWGVRMLLKLVAVAYASATLAACVADPPIAPSGSLGSADDSGVLVVNEGLWFQDNSTLTLYQPAGRVAVQNYFARQNPGERLGDTGNDIVVRGNRAFIVVTTSQNIEVIETRTARSLGRVRVGSGDPRRVAFVDDSTGFVTLLHGDAVAQFDARTLELRERIAVGPAPEGIAAIGRRVFVANSGFGFLRRQEPKAGTISVIDADAGVEQHVIAVGSNPVAVRADTLRRLVYVLFGAPHADSAGGVVALDVSSLDVVRRWDVRGAGVAGEMAIDVARGILYVIAGSGDILRIAVASSGPAQRFAEAPSILGFYGIGVSPADGAVYGSYVTSYTLPGAVIVHALDGTERDRFDAGLNPSSFGFF